MSSMFPLNGLPGALRNGMSGGQGPLDMDTLMNDQFDNPCTDGVTDQQFNDQTCSDSADVGMDGNSPAGAFDNTNQPQAPVETKDEAKKREVQQAQTRAMASDLLQARVAGQNKQPNPTGAHLPRMR
jgi:hypothetical protein